MQRHIFTVVFVTGDKEQNKKEVSEYYCPEYVLRSGISTFPSESVCVPDCL